MLARKAASVRPGHGRPENLAGDYKGLTRQVFNGLAHHDFSLSIGIHIGIVEIVDPMVVRCMDQVNGGFFVNLVTKVTQAPMKSHLPLTQNDPNVGNA